MTPTEFRTRLEAALPPLPPDLDLEFAWVPYDRDAVDALPVPEEDKAILRESGLPSDASPFLTFGGPELDRMPDVQPHLGQEYAPFWVLGGNGSGDLLCLDERDGRIVFHNHDRGMEEVLVNSSVARLAETLCLFQEAMTLGGMADFLTKLRSIDPPAAAGGMWPIEHRVALDDEARRGG